MLSVFYFSARFVDLMHSKQTGAELQGSWTCMIGDQDEAGTGGMTSWRCLTH